MPKRKRSRNTQADLEHIAQVATGMKKLKKPSSKCKQVSLWAMKSRPQVQQVMRVGTRSLEIFMEVDDETAKNLDDASSRSLSEKYKALCGGCRNRFGNGGALKNHQKGCHSWQLQLCQQQALNVQPLLFNTSSSSSSSRGGHSLVMPEGMI